MLDLLVVGAGWSGLSAALTAAEQGLSVRVIAKGLGALHWSAATIDVLGYLPGAPETAVTDPWEALSDLPADHPYRRLGADRVQAAITQMQRTLTTADLVYAGAADGGNLLLPSPAGAARPVCLAPAGQLAGDLADDRPMLVVGFDHLRDFYPGLIVDNLGKQGYQARAVELPLDLITARRDSNTVQLAQAVDEPRTRKRLTAALRRQLRPGERLGLPAILGLADHAGVLAELSGEVAAPVFEIPTLPPSVPGVRLFRALRTLLTARGVRIEAGMEAMAATRRDDTISAVQTATSARPLAHRARAYLLATGGILGGGFTSDHTGQIGETLFDLPLTVPPDRSRWFRSAFLDPAGQPVFRGGIAVDDAFQPVDAAGHRVLENVWVAGGALAHADGIQERSLEGISIATGVHAARAVVDRMER